MQSNIFGSKLGFGSKIQGNFDRNIGAGNPGIVVRQGKVVEW